jgi:PAS domain-containing protein
MQRRSSEMLERLKKAWKKYNPFDIDGCIKTIAGQLSEVQCSLSDVQNKLDAEITTLESDLKIHRALLHSIGEAMPDMMWLKGVDNKYMYANNKICTGLLFDHDPIGKDDIELAIAAKEKFGADNHTFGEKCKNSDLVVRDSLKAQRFLESGKVKGETLYLEVFKAPVFVDGKLIGICGTGRDMTEYVESYRKSGCDGCDTASDIFKKYEYGEDM